MEIILTSQDFFYFKGSDNGQEVLADITEQKSPSTPTGTGTASPQVEASPKSSSRKRSVKFDSAQFDQRGSYTKLLRRS